MDKSYYFPHDYNARNDVKVRKLIKQHGMAGYGIFWSILEDLYQNNNEMDLDFEDIAYYLKSKPNVIKSIIKDFDLFTLGSKTFGSETVRKKLDIVASKSAKATKSIKTRWEIEKSKKLKLIENQDSLDTNVLQTNNERNTNVDTNLLQTNNECNTINKEINKIRKEIKTDFVSSTILKSDEPIQLSRLEAMKQKMNK